MDDKRRGVNEGKTDDVDLEGQASSSPSPRNLGKFKKILLLIGLALGYELSKAYYHTKSRNLDFGTLGQWGFDFAGLTDSLQSVEKSEKIFLSVPNSKSALATSRKYATHPHLAGSDEVFNDAKEILKLFQDQLGITPPSTLPLYSAGTPESRDATLRINELTSPSAWIDTYYPIMNTGVKQALEILDTDGKSIWTADLVEDGDPRDPEAAKYRDFIPPWHGFSADGDVTGRLVYANYGRKEDFENLLDAGTNFTGKVVLVRYGAIYRGLKVKGAEELGAAGVLIYSDPRDDGSVIVENGYKPYPAGPARNPQSIQRGSVQYLSSYPGDPTTPGYPAYENATRVEGTNIPSIPSLPISWANAQRLLLELSDSRSLPGRASNNTVRLVNRVDTKVMPIWNTMAVIPGHIKNETVLIGCHRDAWVMGAADPTSGTTSLIEVVKGLGELKRGGSWKPLRNIVIASWDAEEYGLVGSTEWAEDFAEWIGSNVVAYLNLDVSVAGSAWVASASPSLANLIKTTAQEIPHPTDPKRTLWDARSDEGPYHGEKDLESVFPSELRSQHAEGTGIEPLGSGSDFTVFLQRLGVASMDQGFAFTPSDAVYHYHSIYDSQHWQEVYGDPTFERHTTVAKHLGLMTLRVANSIILPLNTTQYALELDDYLDEVEALTMHPFSKLRKSIHKLQQASKALDTEKDDAEKKFKALLNNRPLSSTSSSDDCTMKWIFGLIKQALSFESKPSPIHEFIKAVKRIQSANTKLASFEKGFISEEGIKDREWYRHLGVAPGKWLGYGATTFPALTEALTIEKNLTLAHYEADRLTDLIDTLAVTIKV
ncbi:peptidase M28 family protein [Abortiporus biennis]